MNSTLTKSHNIIAARIDRARSDIDALTTVWFVYAVAILSVFIGVFVFPSSRVISAAIEFHRYELFAAVCTVAWVAALYWRRTSRFTPAGARLVLAPLS
ncbi:MAG: hypothetical protein P4L33_00005, partial [Capsulimonadaceae bacterium]|nr:hypothetical protein [Capsulimonadaceae bacterium]